MLDNFQPEYSDDEPEDTKSGQDDIALMLDKFEPEYSDDEPEDSPTNELFTKVEANDVSEKDSLYRTYFKEDIKTLKADFKQTSGQLNGLVLSMCSDAISAKKDDPQIKTWCKEEDAREDNFDWLNAHIANDQKSIESLKVD